MQELKPRGDRQSSFSATTVLPGPTRKTYVSSNDGKGALMTMVTRSPTPALNVYRSALLPGRLNAVQSVSVSSPLTGVPGVIGVTAQFTPVPVSGRLTAEAPAALKTTLPGAGAVPPG